MTKTKVTKLIITVQGKSTTFELDDMTCSYTMNSPYWRFADLTYPVSMALFSVGPLNMQLRVDRVVRLADDQYKFYGVSEVIDTKFIVSVEVWLDNEKQRLETRLVELEKEIKEIRQHLKTHM